MSLTGANAGGAAITTIPNYELWVHEVNEAGGLELPDGSRLPIEVVVYDDRSSSEDLVRAVERLTHRTRSISSCRHGAPASILPLHRCSTASAIRNLRSPR